MKMAGMLTLTPSPLDVTSAALYNNDGKYAAGIRSRDLFQPSRHYKARGRSGAHISLQRPRSLEGNGNSLFCISFSGISKKSKPLLKESNLLSHMGHIHGQKENPACIKRHVRHHLVVRGESLGFSSQRQYLFKKSIFQHSRMPSTLFHFNAFPIRSTIVPSATIGPDEPHVASTAWPEDGLLEKQGIGFWEEEIKSADLEGFLSSKLPSHPKLYRGQLKNGLRYVILPNKVPPNRFEAHMEIHAGSVDEEEDEQGIAHMIEHVAFLGSKKREKLLGTGARSNAYTDFHHTVFHVHSPFKSKDSDGSLLPFVLDALHEIAFQPKFLPSRVEKERQAILSERQMMNNIEYRLDCQLLQQLHSENKLGSRFPIGLEEQIKKWDVEAIKRFHERWYFPANATVYIVGDIDSVPKTVYHIDAVFGRTPSGSEFPIPHPPNAFGTMAKFLAPKLPSALAEAVIGEKPSTLGVLQSKQLKRERHAIRPPVKHEWSLPGAGQIFKEPYIFQHELLQNFSIHLFCKIPVIKVQTYGDLRDVLMKRIFLTTLHFRINTRYKSSNPPFTAIELDHSDSGREGCTISTLTVTAEPRNWQDAIKVAVQEVRRLKEFGVTNGELTRYMSAVIKDSEHSAAMVDNVPSIDNLDFIMESYALGHTVMDQKQGHESLLAVAETVTLEDVNSAGAKVLEYIADFGKPSAPLPAAIVASVPKRVHKDGIGDVEFEIFPEDIISAINDGLKEHIEPEPELEVPKELISASQLECLWLQYKPSFVALDHDNTIEKLVDKDTGIIQRKLSNGICINYKVSQNEAKGGVMRLVVGGGKARETLDSKGAVIIGVRTLSESGRVEGFSREQVELFCFNHLINCALESNEELICMDFHFNLRDGGMRAAFQLLHMVIEHNVWLEDAFDRARQLSLSHYYAMPKSLERATAHRLMCAMLKGDERFLDPSPQTIQSLTLPVVKDAVLKQFVTDNMEVSIVGDFTEEDIETCILDYLGTIKARKSDYKEANEIPITFLSSNMELQNQQVFLKDSDERACAYIAGQSPNRWGFTIDGQDLNNIIEPVPDLLTEEQAQSLAPNGMEVMKDADGKLFWKKQNHPLYCCVTLTLLAEIINSRLFTTVRDSLGLTYDVSFELNLYDRLKFGWFVISVTSTPGKVYKAVDACKNVLRGLHSNRITQNELDRAKRTLLMRHESDIKSNPYWLGLLTHLQSPSVLKKDISCIKDLVSYYEATTIDDLYNTYSYLKVDDDSLFTCIGVAGSQGGEEPAGLEMEKDGDDNIQDLIPRGRRSTTMTLPTT